MLTVEPGHNRGVGILLWLGGGLAALIVARLVPLRRGSARLAGALPELFAALFAAGVCGLLATAHDFGGWREPDWRAGLFAALGAFAAAGATRAFRKNPAMADVPAPKHGGPS